MGNCCCNDSNGRTLIIMSEAKHYGLFKFLGDCFMTLLTGGLWLIWVFVREMRKGRA